MQSAKDFFELYIKWPLEFITLVAACFFFFLYWAEADNREKSARLQTLQLTQICNSLASNVDGSEVWNYQMPKTFDDWDVANLELDRRIAWLNDKCLGESLYTKPTRLLKPN